MGEPSATGGSASSAGGSCPRRWCRRARSWRRRSATRGPTRRSAHELDAILRDYAGRPSILTECHNLGGKLGLRLLLKREDLNHTGSHKINNVLGQALLARRMGKTRLVAETGAGQHGVATATAAALFGLECKVYMGAVDVERQELNVFRMRLLGTEVEAVESGSRTLKDAVNEALRDWVATVGDTHYCLGSVMGPHPYPWMVRELHRVVGDEAREQCRAPHRRRPRRRRGVRRRRVQRGRDLLRLRRHRGAAGRRRAGRWCGRRARRARRRPRHAQLPDAGRARPGRGGPLGVRRARLPGRRPGALVPGVDRSGRVPAGRPTPRCSARSSCWPGPRGSSPPSRRPTPSPGSSAKRRRCPARPCSCACPGAATRTSPRPWSLLER